LVPYTGVIKAAKQELIELLQQLPDDELTDALLYELEFKLSVLRGLAEARRGDVISHEELKERIIRWQESSGQYKRADRASIKRGFDELRRREGISHEEIVKHLAESRNRAKRDI